MQEIKVQDVDREGYAESTCKRNLGISKAFTEKYQMHRLPLLLI